MSYTSREQGLKDYERTRAYESHPGLPDEYFEDNYDQELPPDPFGTDLFDRVQAPLNKGQIFLASLLNSKDQNGVNFTDNILADSSKDAPKPLAVQQGQFDDVGPGPLPPIPGATQQIPVIPYQEERYNPFEGQFITLPDGRVVPRTPENSVPGP